jgi:hypothetical protein
MISVSAAIGAELRESFLQSRPTASLERTGNVSLLCMVPARAAVPAIKRSVQVSS